MRYQGFIVKCVIWVLSMCLYKRLLVFYRVVWLVWGILSDMCGFRGIKSDVGICIGDCYIFTEVYCSVGESGSF